MWWVMEKLGMRREAHFRKGVQLDGAAWEDDYLYGILAKDWFPGDWHRRPHRADGQGRASSALGKDSRAAAAGNPGSRRA